MPRLFPPEWGNGKRPSDPDFVTLPAAGMSLPVLDVSDATHELVGQAHDAARDPEDPTMVLLGHVVLIDNPRPVGAPDRTGHMFVSLAGSTLHEAATEVISAFADQALDMPRWVACSDEQLAAVLAEHFTMKGYSTCKQIPLDEVPS